ncbi:MAG: ABC transporter substrate-binding protein [Planctomycetota bacterium]
MMSRDRVAALFLILVATLPLAGCGQRAETPSQGTPVDPSDAMKYQGNAGEGAGSGGTTDGVGKPSAAPQHTRGGKPPATDDALLLSYSNDPDTLNLILANDTVSEAFQRHVYETLADRKFGNPDEWEPGLAESWEFDKETLTYTIHLRKGVYWHPMKLPDGTPLPRTQFTAKDVKFTIDCILNENTEATTLRSFYLNPNAKEESQKYKINVKVIDDFTITVQWTEPYFNAMEFTLGISILPRHVYSVNEKGEPVSLDVRNSKEFAEAFNSHWANTKMCGTGPLIFQEWRKEDQVTLVRNPDYWGNPFYFDRVVYLHISNPNTALQKTLQNELDWSPIPEKDHYLQSKQEPSVKDGKVTLVDYDYPGYRYLGFNQKRELFQDKRVRTAISYAVPVDEIIERIYHGLAKRLTGPFPPGSAASDETLQPIPFDLEKARQLLDEAGWKDSNNDGTRDKVVNGKQVEAVFDLIIYSESPQYRQIAEVIRENCRKIGIDAKISPTKWALMLQQLHKKEFDACILGWALSWKMDPFQIWHGSQADAPDSSNSVGYANPEVDKLIEQLRVTMDEDKQSEIYKQIHRIIYDDQPYVFLFRDMATAGHDARLENIKFFKIRPGVDQREWISNRPRKLAK